MRKLVHETAVGRLTLLSDEGALVGCHFERPTWPDRMAMAEEGTDRVLDRARSQLDEYFAGSRTQFDLELAPRGTAFQRSVWRALVEIPFGETRHYGGIAKRIGQPTASRAVGAANGQNPIAIIIPCHRVIGADGSLTGFGGGIERKKYLLQLEASQQGLFDHA